MATPFDGIGGLLGIDPAQLQQLMAQFAPSEDDRKAANMQALAQLGFGLLGTRKGYEWDQVGNAAQNALQARQGALQGAQQGKADQFKMAQGLAKYKQEQDAAKQAQLMNNEIGALLQGGGEEGKAAKWQIYLQAAEKAALARDLPAAKHWAELAEKHKPKYSQSPQVGIDANGQPYQFVLDDAGNEKRLAAGAKPDFKEVSTNKEKLFYDPLTGRTGGSFAMQTTPDADQRHQEWQADYGLRRNADQRAAASAGGGASKPQLVNGQWVFPPDAQNPTGRAVTPAGMETKAEKPSDEQLKTGGFVERMQFADKYISAIESDTLKPGTNVVAKEGYRPGAGEGMVQGLGGVPLVGGVLGKAGALTQAWVEPRAAAYKNVKKAWIRAKLRKESGAVIGAEEEADEDRTFFPQPGDPVEVVKQKAALRKNVEQSMARQARGGYQGGAVQDDPLGLRR